MTSPFLAFALGHGANNWCDQRLLAVAPGYSSKQLAARAWPPGVRCAAELSDGRTFEAWWPLGW